MDRYDESKTDNDSEETSSAGSTDILGLGGSPVPKMPGDPSASDDPESVRQRRERVRASESPLRHEEGDRHGATGIDMGASGQGTDLSGE